HEIITIVHARAYVREVKETFHDDKSRYAMFLTIMKEGKARRDIATAVARLKELFHGYHNLIVGINKFLPPHHYIRLQGDDNEGEESFVSTAAFIEDTK
ncbi:hypothetical protein CARUB_v10003722mg, partial [Capsella rubella]